MEMLEAMKAVHSKHELNSPLFLLWKRVTISTQSSSPKASKVWFLAMEHTFSICYFSPVNTEPLCNFNVSSDPICFSVCTVCTRTGRMHTGILRRKDACTKFCRSQGSPRMACCTENIMPIYANKHFLIIRMFDGRRQRSRKLMCALWHFPVGVLEDPSQPQ